MNQVIICIMVVFMLVGVVDKICGNRWGYGNKFDEGMNTLGPLALAMVGIIAAVPIIAKYIEPLVSSVYTYVGASPAMFGGTLLACDMGGYALSMQMAGTDQAIGNFAGLITGSMMGVTFVFTIPVALSIINKRYYSYISLGVLIGLLTIPLGCISGGMAMSLWGYSLDFLQIIQNLIPLIVLDAIIILRLLCWPVKTLRVFVVFGSFITKLIIALLGIAVAQHLTGIRLPVFSMMVQADPSTGISPLTDGFITVGNIAMVLLGAFPMVYFITTKFSKLIIRIGKKSGLNESDCTGHPLPMGSEYDFFGPEAHFDIEQELLSKGRISQREYENRQLLRRVMTQAGFLTITSEWWHFNAVEPASVAQKYKVIE